LLAAHEAAIYAEHPLPGMVARPIPAES